MAFFLAILAFALPYNTDWDAVRLALAAVESGHNPEAIGAAGERGEFQILPAVSAEHGGGYEWATAARIFQARLKPFPRTPTAQDLYLLWHRPGAYARAGYDLSRMSPTVQARAERFARLYHYYANQP